MITGAFGLCAIVAFVLFLLSMGYQPFQAFHLGFENSSRSRAEEPLQESDSLTDDQQAARI
jgi:hypothetical protein